eukprot:365854-Chlamydomonas_euryale.AAC.11
MHRGLGFRLKPGSAARALVGGLKGPVVEWWKAGCGWEVWGCGGSGEATHLNPPAATHCCPSRCRHPLLSFPAFPHALCRPRANAQSGLRYGQFYDAVAASLALLPALASPAYLDRKFSSTVTTSLITGVPVIVPSEFLKAYAFLDARTVFLQREGETVMGAAARLAGLPAADVDALRARIASLREQLNANAAEVVTQVLAGTVEQPGRGPLREPADARFDMDGGVGSAGA